MRISHVISPSRVALALPTLTKNGVVGPIGFDLSLEKLNLVQMRFSGAHPEIVAVASVEHESDRQTLLQNPKLIKPLVKDALKQGRFKGRKVVSTLPGNKLRLEFVNYKRGRDQSNAEAITHALRERYAASLDSSVVDFIPMQAEHEDQFERVALAAIADRNEVDNFLELLRFCGLEASALEIGPVAIRRLITSLGTTERTGKVLAINFGTQKSYLTVLWNGNLLLDRDVKFGMDDLVDVLRRELEVSRDMALGLLNQYGLFGAGAAQNGQSEGELEPGITNTLADILKPLFMKLAAEIQEVLVYVASETRGGAIEQIFLLGSLARIAGTDRLIDKLVSIPVKTINPLYGFETSDAAAPAHGIGPIAGIAVATGLALRGFYPHV